MSIWGATKKVAGAIRRGLFPENVWREVHVSSDRRPEATLKRYAYLRERGVRCYLKNLPSPSGRGVSSGMMSLRVHKEDVGKAYQLMAEIRD